jgi:hypothetical protein
VSCEVPLDYLYKNNLSLYFPANVSKKIIFKSNRQDVFAFSQRTKIKLSDVSAFSNWFLSSHYHFKCAHKQEAELNFSSSDLEINLRATKRLYQNFTFVIVKMHYVHKIH